MIDPATLPKAEIGTELTVGQRFEILGRNFDLWPSEVVCGFSRERILDTSVVSVYNMRSVEKSDTRLVVEVTQGYTFTVAHTFEFFASPFNMPRELLTYTRLPLRDGNEGS